MNRTVRDSLAGVDAIVVVLEAVQLTDADRAVLALLPPRVPAIAALNKVDRLADKARLLPYLSMLEQAHPFAAIVPVSAEKGMQLGSAHCGGRPPSAGRRAAVSLRTT